MLADFLIATCANATLALEGAIATCNIDGKELELPSWTFAATAHAAVRSKFNPKFVDINDEWRSNPSSKSDLLVDVLPFGDEMRSSAYPPNLKSVVIDGAASFGNLRNINFLSRVPQALIISLHSTKLIGAGEGAIFITNYSEWADRFRQWTAFGFDENRTAQSEGTNAKLSEYAAAVGVASFEHWQKIRGSYEELTSWAYSTSGAEVTSTRMAEGREDSFNRGRFRSACEALILSHICSSIVINPISVGERLLQAIALAMTKLSYAFDKYYYRKH